MHPNEIPLVVAGNENGIPVLTRACKEMLADATLTPAHFEALGEQIARQTLTFRTPTPETAP